MLSIKHIEKNNELYHKGLVGHQLGLNKLADLSPDQYKTMLNRIPAGDAMDSIKQFDQNDDISYINGKLPLPVSFDWRDEGVVTRVKDQGICGSCFAFAAIATIESAYAIGHNLTNKDLLEFSEQEILDCTYDYPYASLGCNGGYVFDAYYYALVHGVVSESDYPYEDFNNAERMACKLTNDLYKVKIRNFFYLDLYSSDDAIMQAIYNRGPVATHITAGDLDFQLYSKGILTSVGDQNIVSSTSGHVLTVVGWGTQNGINFWICKNSWGTEWGENGYVKLKRGINIRGFNYLTVYPYNVSNYTENSSMSLNQCRFCYLLFILSLISTILYLY